MRPTVESLLKIFGELSPIEIWWQLRETDQEFVDKGYQTSFPQMMDQIESLLKQNKIILDKDGQYIWLEASEEMKESLKNSVPL